MKTDGSFDFESSLARLATYRDDAKKLQDSAKLESIFLRKQPQFQYEDSNNVAFINWAMNKDDDAVSLLGSNWSGLVPVVAKYDTFCKNFTT